MPPRTPGYPSLSLATGSADGGLTRCRQSQGDRTALWNQETGGGLLDPPFNIKARERNYMFHDRFSIILHGELLR
ncbi:hypothetical protein Q7C36_021627 [Tachysurus vachellii]|uniref:Uncharacterized protein n=1 Tax=Tachysurus vachellii TaxID=175792 RepID=A0AA88IP13_TACVA|nr:hypothetical protein Q7C36_021627 [Tachysurus vachellii]